MTEDEIIETGARALCEKSGHQKWADQSHTTREFYRIDICYLRAVYQKVGVLLEQGWQDIETAPKDGRQIWLYQPDLDPDQFVAVFAWTDIPKSHRDYWEGWLFADEMLVNNSDLELSPTHWRPLPASPEALAHDRERTKKV